MDIYILSSSQKIVPTYNVKAHSVKFSVHRCTLSSVHVRKLIILCEDKVIFCIPTLVSKLLKT